MISIIIIIVNIIIVTAIFIRISWHPLSPMLEFLEGPFDQVHYRAEMDLLQNLIVYFKYIYNLFIYIFVYIFMYICIYVYIYIYIDIGIDIYI